MKRIFEETGPDFSAEVCGKARIDDLDLKAVEVFRSLWARHSGKPSIARLPPEEMLEDAELLVDRRLTYASLILLGSKRALGKHLAQSEVVFEYRSNEASIPYQQRVEFREGFFLITDELWNLVNLRNEVQPYQDGFFEWKIKTFDESVVREAILNAISHRDYRLNGSVFVRQFPRKLEVESPGGFPPGITTRNILMKQSPRNRRIAEALAKCGLVERAGQGMNRIFERCVREGKPRPDFTGTDPYQVFLTIRGEIQNPAFLRFLEEVGKERLESFSTLDLLALDLMSREEPVPADLRPVTKRLVELGVVESVGRGRGTRYLLSRRFHRFLGKPGAYTRKRGLDKETNKALLLQHIERERGEGSRLEDLMQVLPGLSRYQVQALLKELKREGKAHPRGQTRAARWFPSASLPIEPEAEGDRRNPTQS